MSDNVTKFPAPPRQRDWITEPYLPERRVELNGYQIPLLSAQRHENGGVALCLDRRFLAEFSTNADAFQAASLVANALAIGQGYSHYGATTRDMPFAPLSIQLNIGEGE